VRTVARMTCSGMWITKPPVGKGLACRPPLVLLPYRIPPYLHEFQVRPTISRRDGLLETGALSLPPAAPVTLNLLRRILAELRDLPTGGTS